MARARKRNTASSPPPPLKMNIEGYDEDHNDKQSRHQLKWRLTLCKRYLLKTFRILTSVPILMITCALVLASLFVSDEGTGQSTMMKIGMGYIFVARPILTTVAIVGDIDLEGKRVGESTKSAKRAESTIITRIIALSFLMSIVCNQFPRWLSALVACIAIFAFGLASRQRQLQSTVSSSTQKEHDAGDVAFIYRLDGIHRIWSRLGLKERAALAGIGLVISMLIENFLIWVVSATYQPGIDGTSIPLQDNGRIVLEKLAMTLFQVNAPWMAKRSLQSLRNGLNVQWALVSSFGASLVCLELQLEKRNHRSLGGLTFRALSTLATARIIRTISFALTVLPSQVPNCYASHFPAPPESWSEWLMVGFLPNTRGGCNDLILSGHATVTSTIACAFTSVASNTSFSIAVWTLVVLDYGIEAYQGLHYSVDMWLGCIVTCLLWHLLQTLEFGGIQRKRSQQHEGKIDSRTAQQTPLDATILGMYALPALLAFLVLTVVPEAMVNYFLVGCSIWAGVVFARCGFTIYVQHILISRCRPQETSASTRPEKLNALTHCTDHATALGSLSSANNDARENASSLVLSTRVNSTFALSPLTSAAAAAAANHLASSLSLVSSPSSSFSMGWTLPRSLASSFVLLHPLYISTTSSVTKASNRMTISTTATTVASSSVTAARIPKGNILAGAVGGGRSDNRCRKSWRATRFLGSFCHLKQSRSSILTTILVSPPRLAESSISSAVSSSSSSTLAFSNSSSNLSRPLNDSGIILSPSRYFLSLANSTNDESEGRRMIIGSKLSSARAQAAIKLLPSYIADARAVTKYSPISSPEGALQLSVAENQLCELPITGMIGIVEGGRSEGVMEGGEGVGKSVTCNREEMTLTDVLSQLASSKLPRPSDIDGGDAITTGNVFQREMIYYQPTQGVPSLRRVMANYLQSLLLSPGNMQSSSSSSRKFNPDNVILGAGCNAVLENLCMCLSNPGDAALIPTPYYASFEFDLSARAGCHIVPVNTFNHHPDGRTAPSTCNEPISQDFYYPNRSSLDAAYHRAQLETGRPPRIFLLSHPNNPLGICYPPHVVQECIDWCREKEVHLISDEIYAGSVYRKERTLGKEKWQPTFVSAMALGSSTSETSSHSGLGLGPYIHLVYALSKDFALSGLRVGVSYTENEEILLPLQKLNDMCQMSSQTQLLVERMMCANAIMDEGNTRGNNNVDLSQKFFDVYMKVNNDHIRARCDKLHAFLSDVGIPSLPADSGLFVWMDLRKFLPPLAAGVSEVSESIESKESRERQLYLLLMNKYGLLFTPGMSMRSERAGFFRFVFTAATEKEFDLGLIRLRKMVEEMRMR